MSHLPVQDCPDPLRRAFLELMRWTLLVIRNGSDDSKICFLYADHMHNVPELLADFRPELLAYYWEAERPGFLGALRRMGCEAPAAFDTPWSVVKSEYHRLCQSRDC